MPTTDQALPRARGTPLHRQMFLVLRERIIAGEYPAGSLIPKEEDLCTMFGVSRITVRRTLADLEAQGFVQRRQGLGTFVPADLPVPRQAATLGYVDALHKTALETRVEVIGVKLEAVPALVAAQLQLEPQAQAIHAVRLRKSGNTVLMVSDAWVPERYSKWVTAASLKKQALYEILMSQGVAFGRVIQEVTAVSATPTLAQWLDVEVGMPLMRVTRIVYDTDQTPVQHLTITVSPERSRIVTDMQADAMNTLRTGQIVHDVAHGNARPAASGSRRRGAG
ncbi:GntR family transcriptional regulator [Paraburkholderia oxyphila]|uniref:GntR family transcriptional regulator n=1 Tax=Paraburkholderia oxyphila TaxID=614212 RepID=UPI0005BE7C3A|nr:GntR family transcriptional regulator [Paraburkholderia oxyphila]